MIFFDRKCTLTTLILRIYENERQALHFTLIYLRLVIFRELFEKLFSTASSIYNTRLRNRHSLLWMK